MPTHVVRYSCKDSSRQEFRTLESRYYSNSKVMYEKCLEWAEHHGFDQVELFRRTIANTETKDNQSDTSPVVPKSVRDDEHISIPTDKKKSPRNDLITTSDDMLRILLKTSHRNSEIYARAVAEIKWRGLERI